MKRKKIIGTIVVFLLGFIIIAGIGVSFQVKNQVKELFKMNKKLQEAGYYMADFEFQMLGFAYYLDKGHYIKALTNLSDYHSRLSQKTTLTKIPIFKNSQDEIRFYLNLQNPKTGAFIDDSAPYCTYFSVTENILLHLEALTDATPLKLKYPLTFLNEINTQEKQLKYLNDISYVGWIGAKFPQTSFHFARDMLSNARPDNVIERNNLYNFSPEWKHAMLKWMYEFQDAETGLWGPKNKKTHKLLKLDISNTYSIVKKYRTPKGEDIYEEFPLRYRDVLFNSALKQLKDPIPDDNDFAWIHEWNLKQAKGIKMLLTLLWKDASLEDKAAVKKIIANFIKVSFDKYYVEKDGAFSYYPNSEHATVDGMNNMIMKRIGALSYDRQKRYWGAPEENTKNLGIVNIDTLCEQNLDTIRKIPNINSWRICTIPPNFNVLFENVWAVVYPKKTNVLDITELVPNIIQWANTSTLSTGNWKSMANIKNEYASINIKKPLIYTEEFPFDKVNNKFKEVSEIFVIGFDILQIPRFIIKFSKPLK